MKTLVLIFILCLVNAAPMCRPKEPVSVIRVKETELGSLSFVGSDKKSHPFSAASGIVVTHQSMHMIADDELFLASFKRGALANPQKTTLLPGILPEEYEARKKLKPDFEELILLPKTLYPPHGALLALPSGSRPNRVIGSLIRIDAQGMPAGKAERIDFKMLFAQLKKLWPEVNIEGGVYLENRGMLRLFQRGNNKSGVNAMVDIPLKKAFEKNDTWDRSSFHIIEVNLGLLGEKSLGFSGADMLPDGRIVFCASAEDTVNPYDDGQVTGSAVGILSADGKLEKIIPLTAIEKIEGISFTRDDDNVERLYLVSDADNRKRASKLFTVNFLDL